MCDRLGRPVWSVHAAVFQSVAVHSDQAHLMELS